MNRRQLESRTLEIISRVESGQPIEDSTVELKREWPKADGQTARRIAGHANASRGEPILWLIGVDEEEGMKGVGNDVDLANWYPMIQKCFSEQLAPELINHVNVHRDDLTVVALLFDTNRAPFLVKNPARNSPNCGPVELEVPWREGTRIRSARRSDLLLLLSPSELLPDVEIYSENLLAIIGGSDEVGNYIPESLSLHLELYIVPKNSTELVIPFHRCKAWYSIPGAMNQTPFKKIWMSPGGGRTYSRSNQVPSCLSITHTTNEVIIKGPGMLTFHASTALPDLSNRLDSELNIEVHLSPTNAPRPKILTTVIPYPEEHELG